ncbi:hypothetical protein E2C01_086811 [Portunus trituberculatus]|uniref:Uncharacterized protein n=1 Tax=Portunus trituberculatus TaxID=210409 RepID=A0A5B7JHD0_PORTR|nr:hypothetical protein [Portunus trituberculatus]
MAIVGVAGICSAQLIFVNHWTPTHLPGRPAHPAIPLPVHPPACPPAHQTQSQVTEVRNEPSPGHGLGAYYDEYFFALDTTSAAPRKFASHNFWAGGRNRGNSQRVIIVSC